jgi:hypothetical protein
LKMRLITWIEWEKQTDTALGRIQISKGSASRSAAKGGIVLCLTVLELRETVTEGLQP